MKHGDPMYRKCKQDNCDNKVHTRDFCMRHDPRMKKRIKECKEDNFINQAHTSRGLCKKHDPMYGQCKEENCDSQGITRGRCKKHDKLYREKEKRHS